MSKGRLHIGAYDAVEITDDHRSQKTRPHSAVSRDVANDEGDKTKKGCVHDLSVIYRINSSANIQAAIYLVEQRIGALHITRFVFRKINSKYSQSLEIDFTTSAKKRSVLANCQ